MNLTSKLIILSISLFTSIAMAEVQTFTIGTKKIHVTIPEQWVATQDLFGIPLLISGPMVGETRPVLSILPILINGSNITNEQIKKMFEQYANDRKAWVESFQGTLLSIDQLRELEWSKNQKVYRIGSRYKINNINFEEASYYLLCDNNLYNLKSSMRDEHKQYQKDLDKIVESFSCQ